MKISTQHIPKIKQIVQELAGSAAQVRLFGSRLNDQCRGGDLDLLVTVSQTVENPAWLIAQRTELKSLCNSRCR